MRYITNVRCVVRVDGRPITVDPSTHLPEGVTEEEVERLLRFEVIREAPPETAPAVVKRARKDVPLEVPGTIAPLEVPEVLD